MFGERIARAIGETRLAAPQGALVAPRSRELEPADPGRIDALRQLVSSSLGPLRAGTTMTAALGRLEGWRAASCAESDLLTNAGLALASALERRESRGAHYRSDHPAPRAELASRSFVTPRPAPVESLAVTRSQVA